MKASELRIGNIVLIPSHSDESKPLVPCIEKQIKGISKFSELDFTEYWYPDQHLVHINHCIGIPLTEEWLLKVGFKDQLSNWWFDGIFLHKYFSYVMFEYEGKNIELKYVHQLQNLYFALTQKELEV